MKSILTVVTPAVSQDLTTLENVKLELGITTSAEDDTLAMWITQASGDVADYCNRTFGEATVLETIRNKPVESLFYRRNVYEREPESIVLRRYPVSSFTSVIEDGTTLVKDTDFECDPETGIMTRLCDGNERRWRFCNLLATYTAGYELVGTLPTAIERATITLVKLLRSGATRDPLLVSEAIPGVRTVQYAVGRAGGTDTWPPLDVMNALAKYRQVDV